MTWINKGSEICCAMFIYLCLWWDVKITERVVFLATALVDQYLERQKKFHILCLGDIMSWNLSCTFLQHDNS